MRRAAADVTAAWRAARLVPFFGNDDTGCTSGFTATLSAYDVLDQLIGSASVVANMNDTADRFLGLRSDTLIYRTVLSYGTASGSLWGVVGDFSYGGDALHARSARLTCAPHPPACACAPGGCSFPDAPQLIDRQESVFTNGLIISTEE